MKDKIVIDIGRIMDEVFDAALNLQDAVQEGLHGAAHKGDRIFSWDEDIDLYPSYTYPPLNVYVDEEKKIVFEFALAGFSEKDLQLEFSGDHMLFSAKVDERFLKKDNVKYFKHRLKLKDVKEQKYYVPAEKFDREKTTAVYTGGILTVTIPPRENAGEKTSTKVSIKKE
jgi:HSP20 family molecular chaperone IbpA